MSEASILERRRAVERFHGGETVTAICQSLGRTREWFYKWLTRSRSGEDDWAEDRSRRPRQVHGVEAAQEAAVVTVRQSLSAQGVFCGAQAIAWELAALQPRQPVPSLRTINRILARRGLVERRRGPYVAKGRPYPVGPAERPGQRHQTDFVGPCYLRGPIRFYSLHSIDVATGRCAIAPVLDRRSQTTIDALWAMWHRLGMPEYQQVDNEMVFYGSRTHPRGMGPLIRLCLAHEVEPWFIPPGEPWRNGVVERFNLVWHQHGPLRQPVETVAALGDTSLTFEQRHNGAHRYSKLGGKTPNAALAASQVRLRFPPRLAAPRHPLPKPDAGRYHLVRFIRHDEQLDIFGEHFRVPPEAAYTYVRATVDVATQQLRVYLDGRVIDEQVYRLR
jgi:transposase InsO family protein